MGDMIWTEKYRPKRVDDIVGNPAVKKKLKGYAKDPSSTPQCMIFVGKAGTGKTTSALAFVRECGIKSQDFQEWNASDERGIDFIRDKVKAMAKTGTFGGTIKIIFLDEADALTPDAQGALRQIIEKHGKICKIILSVNYPHKIKAPIWSRSAGLQFLPPTREDVKVGIIDMIAEKEGMTISEENKNTIISLTDGIPRDIVIKLQELNTLSVDGDITDQIMGEAFGNFPTKIEVAKILQKAILGDIKGGVQGVLSMGVSGSSYNLVLELMLDLIMSYKDKFNEYYHILQCVGDCDKAITYGGTPSIHFAVLLVEINENFKSEARRDLNKRLKGHGR